MESNPHITGPSEDELRDMLEAREREKDLQRKQLSRRASVILLLIVLSGAAAVYFMPDRETKVVPVKQAAAALPPTMAGPVPDELKPFSIKPEKNAEKDNIRFASELLRFLQPGDPVANPSTPPAKP